MQKSFIDRIFPQPTSPPLPTSQREQRSPASSRITLPSTPSPIISSTSPNPLRTRHASIHASQALQPTPLSASIIHHNDPLLPVDRAARALQKTIQSLLDAQSDGLSAGLGGSSRDDVSSVGSLTPTPSVATTPRNTTGSLTTPVRQPTPKKISLRVARKGLVRSMQDFAKLREEELKILDSQSQGRRSALDKVQAFEGKRSGLQRQIDAIKQEGTSASSEQLHKEAQVIGLEIRELEDKLFELKARQRHVLAQASQIENSVSSKLSSYMSSLDLVDREIKQYLKQPPLQSTLPTAASMGQSMYDLKPDRRTLAMAKEQWSNEQAFLDAKRTEAEQEKAALQAGSTMWRESIERISLFEKDLRAATRDPPQSESTTAQSAEQKIHSLLADLDATINLLSRNLHLAESKQWNLLICCLAPELEALTQGRSLIRQTLGLPPLESTPWPEANDEEEHEHEQDSEPDGPPHDLLNGSSSSPSGESNKSLEETLKAFRDPEPPPVADLKGKSALRSPPAQSDGLSNRGFGFGATKVTADSSESEEDDPGPDFLLSHS
jgi:hypothetical protein